MPAAFDPPVRGVLAARVNSRLQSTESVLRSSSDEDEGATRRPSVQWAAIESPPDTRASRVRQPQPAGVGWSRPNELSPTRAHSLQRREAGEAVGAAWRPEKESGAIYGAPSEASRGQVKHDGFVGYESMLGISPPSTPALDAPVPERRRTLPVSRQSRESSLLSAGLGSNTFQPSFGSTPPDLGHTDSGRTRRTEAAEGGAHRPSIQEIYTGTVGTFRQTPHRSPHKSAHKLQKLPENPPSAHKSPSKTAWSDGGKGELPAQLRSSPYATFAVPPPPLSVETMNQAQAELREYRSPFKPFRTEGGIHTSEGGGAQESPASRVVPAPRVTENPENLSSSDGGLVARPQSILRRRPNLAGNTGNDDDFDQECPRPQDHRAPGWAREVEHAPLANHLQDESLSVEQREKNPTIFPYQARHQEPTAPPVHHHHHSLGQLGEARPAQTSASQTASYGKAAGLLNKSEASEFEKLQAIHTMGQLYASGMIEARQPLLRAVDGDSKMICVAALHQLLAAPAVSYAIGLNERTHLQRSLTKLLDEPDDSLGTHVVVLHALAHLGAEGGGEGTGLSYMLGVISTMCENQDAAVRGAAVKALGTLCKPPDAHYTERLIPRLRDDDANVREQAVRALARIGAWGGQDAFASALLACASGVYPLSSCAHERVLTIRPFSDNSHSAVKRAAIDALVAALNGEQSGGARAVLKRVVATRAGVAPPILLPFLQEG